jgi:hypothetical protein
VVSSNAVRHGLTAETVIGALENAEDYKPFEAVITATMIRNRRWNGNWLNSRRHRTPEGARLNFKQPGFHGGGAPHAIAGWLTGAPEHGNLVIAG